jgi:hypothetical protein
MHPIAHKSDAGEDRLSVRISGDTYCAVPTKLLRRGAPSEVFSESINKVEKAILVYFQILGDTVCFDDTQ